MEEYFGSGWSDWFQDVGKSVIQTAAQAKYQAPTDLAKMKILAYGPYGELYQEGAPGYVPAAAINGQGLTLSPALMLIGGVVLVAVLMAD